MKSTCLSKLMRFSSWIVLLLLLIGCSGSPAVITSPEITLAPTAVIATPETTVTSTVVVSTPETTVTPTEDLGGLSADASGTLRSLEKLNDYPFYVMHYQGDYPYPRISLPLSADFNFSCSLFAALGTSGDMLYGRNFDWMFSPALLVFTDPSDGYASASMVDLNFLGIDNVTAAKLVDLPLSARDALLAAPSLPFDGMNEYGLVIAMAAIPDEYIDDASYDPSKSNIGSIDVIRQILDHARDVDEALEIFDGYNIDFGGGPPIHYLIADRTGSAVLVEFYQSEMIKLINQVPWHMATNHLRCIAQGDGRCPRYRVISERLSAVNGQLDTKSAMRLLFDVKQASTQWSAVYNMTSGEINIALGGKIDPAYTFRLDLSTP